MQTDILIIGGGVGGCACALAACKEGFNVIMTEETDWIGGQFTTQATPPDEHGWIEKHGCTKTYRQFRKAIRQFYKKNYPLSIEAKNNPTLNPGNGWVSPLCAEPKVFLTVLENILQPFIEKGQLTILKKYVPIVLITASALYVGCGSDSSKTNTVSQNDSTNKINKTKRLFFSSQQHLTKMTIEDSGKKSVEKL